MITRWDPAREKENLPDQPEMLDLMLMKNFGLSKVNKSDVFVHDLSPYQVGWFTRKLADKFSVILLRHVTNDKVIITSVICFVGT